ncbi:polyisoprenoid-binding protein YceI [Pontibacter ummariensis]|uniref:Polyisoprenoid-binding protein YceI n=1 Tax=Pontibacter ummariensis TaxID=1610492 RepID=A0A239BSC0_9BACT|nr:YceI family protein [Pontibacter ummariensis]PRY15690.1 polyisoprenoid-binding protein YceI [Pontibacter ummariensis]SNS09944.1 Polyisoprenoid-binding protein YceI [Pontibacter ummariensis]
MATTKWSLDLSHSELGFKIKHMMISNVTGKFTQFDVQAETEGDDFSNAKVVANIDVTSINTNNEQRDEHLRNADFFGTEAHPNMTFVSTKVERVDEDTFTLYGDLTIKDTTKPVKLTVEDNGVATDPWGNVKAGFSISGKINRKDWGINYNAALETGGVMLGEELKIQGEVQLVKQA